VLPSDLYLRWRSSVLEDPDALREQPAPPPERWLQAIWHHQRLRRDALRLTDGRKVRVLHPGFWSREGGPDFRQAVIQIDGEAARAGEIEIDLHASGWWQHGHDRSPAFKSVILHVIWSAASGRTDTSRPTLALEPVLDAPFTELLPWLQSESGAGWSEEFLGRCCSPLKDLNTESLRELLRQAAQLRFAKKADDIARRAKEGGWEQALWESLFRALGYKHNAWPMQRVAELLPEFPHRSRRGDEAECSPPSTFNPQLLQARLLGLSGLLPYELPATSARFLRQLWDSWWRERDRWQDVALPSVTWRLHGLRPANNPQRRLALAAHWLAKPSFVSELEDWFLKSGSPESLLEKLQPGEDNYWSWHWTPRSPRLAKPQPLIGAARTTDLTVNALLPWFRARAAAGQNESLVRRAEELFHGWPASEDNSQLKQARVRLLGGTRRDLKITAAMQQGLLQILRDFCARSNALCDGCRFPQLVAGLAQERKP
jgi:hypothetical protein